jgi:hypothetical protein
MTIEKIPITSRDQWLKLRNTDITASVAGALLGVHEYVTSFGLWALKSGAIAEDQNESAAMERGRLLEPVAVQLLKERHPAWTLKHGGFYLRDPDARLGATPDVVVHDPERGLGVVQIKSVEGGIFRKKWRDADTGEVAPPLWIAVQGIVEAHLVGAQWAAVAPLVVGFGVDLHLIEIPIHAGVIDRLKAEIVLFWQRVADHRPYEPDYGRDGAIIAQLFGKDDGSTIDLSSDNRIPVLLEEDEQLAGIISTSTERRKEVRTEILAKLGEAAAATCADGWTVTAKTINRKGYEVKPSSYRQIRTKRLQQMEKAS